VSSRSKITGGTLAAVLLFLSVVIAAAAGVLSTLTAGPAADHGRSATASESSPSASRSSAPSERDPDSGLRFVETAALPVEARRTVLIIDRGGPFPYPRDGATFGNRERLLPFKPSGFYREYTVPTPGEDDRGARRIVTGDHDRQFFYTGDHYRTFDRIRR
jgi:ribonuclease T1